MKGQLKLSLLGPLRLCGPSGRPLPLKGAKARALLALLAAERGRVFPQEELVERLWGPALASGKTTPERALTNLRGRVRELRKLHPVLAHTLVTHPSVEGPGGYSLERSPRLWVDLEELARLCARGRALARRGRWFEALPLLEQAARLWQGDFLEEEPYAGWALEIRERWRGRAARCLLRLAEGHARLGQLSQAIERCREASQLRPHEEGVWRALIGYLERAGWRGEALEAWEACRRALGELGLVPSAALRERVERLRRSRRVRASEPEAEVGIEEGEGVPFVGRARELQALREAWEEARAGRGRLELARGRLGEAEAAAEAAAQRARRLGAQTQTQAQAQAREREAEALRLLARVRVEGGRYREAVGPYLRALRLYWALQEGGKRGEAAVLEGLAEVARQRGMYRRARVLGEAALRLYRELGDARGEGNALLELVVLHNLGLVYLEEGVYEVALQHLQEAARGAREVDDGAMESTALQSLGMAYGVLGCEGRALEALRQALERAEGLGQAEQAWEARYQLGWVLGEQPDDGTKREGLRHLEAALQAVRAAGEVRMEAAILHQQGRILSGLGGGWEEAVRLLMEALGLLEGRGMDQLEAVVRADLAALLVEGGAAERTEALREAERAVALLEGVDPGGERSEHGVRIYRSYAAALRAAGRLQEAREAARKAWGLLQRRALGLRDPELRRGYLRRHAPLRTLCRELGVLPEPEAELWGVALSEAACYELLRAARWPEGVRCPCCGSPQIRGHGRVRRGPERRYRCLRCGRTFTDRTGTPLACRNLPLRRLLLGLKWLHRARSWRAARVPAPSGFEPEFDPEAEPEFGAGVEKQREEARELARVLGVEAKTGAALQRALARALEEPWAPALLRALP